MGALSMLTRLPLALLATALANRGLFKIMLCSTLRPSALAASAFTVVSNSAA